MSSSLTLERNHPAASAIPPLMPPGTDTLKLEVKVVDDRLRGLGVSHDGFEDPFALVPSRGGWKRYGLEYQRTERENAYSDVTVDEYARTLSISGEGLDPNDIRRLGVAYGVDVHGRTGRDGTTVWLQRRDDNYLPVELSESIELHANHRVWTTTYWPMSGALPGDPSSHLWATGGPLDKFDQYLERLGLPKGALEFERQPNLNRMFGRPNSGHWIPSYSLSEKDAERTTGVDINGNGTLDENFEYDFLTASGYFGRDGNTNSTMSVGWWGSCDKVALAGCLFEEPKHSVTLEGVTFTTQDIKGLLAVIADGQAGRVEFAGNRYDRRPDVVTTTDGEVIEGTIENANLADFRSGEFFRTDDYGRRGLGDNIVRIGAPRDLSLRRPDGTIQTIPASKVRSMQRESAKDIDPALFHETTQRWLQDGRPFAMDHDSSDHVWNGSFDGARMTEVPSPLSEDQIQDLNGSNGPFGGGKLECWNTELFASGYVSKYYRYWLEKRDGVIVNSGWLDSSPNPDFMWRPSRPATFVGSNPRNPFVRPELVKTIYEQSIA